MAAERHGDNRGRVPRQRAPWLAAAGARLGVRGAGPIRECRHGRGHPRPGTRWRLHHRGLRQRRPHRHRHLIDGLVGGEPVAVLPQRRQRAGLSDRTDASGLTGITGGLNISSADYDNDGYVDVRSARRLDAGRGPPSEVVAAEPQRRFTDVTELPVSSPSLRLRLSPGPISTMTDGWISSSATRRSQPTRRRRATSSTTSGTGRSSSRRPGRYGRSRLDQGSASGATTTTTGGPTSRCRA